MSYGCQFLQETLGVRAAPVPRGCRAATGGPIQVPGKVWPQMFVWLFGSEGGLELFVS